MRCKFNRKEFVFMQKFLLLLEVLACDKLERWMEILKPWNIRKFLVLPCQFSRKDVYEKLYIKIVLLQAMHVNMS